MVPSFKALDIRLDPFPPGAVQMTLPRGHAALPFMDVGVGYVDRARDVGAVGLLRIYDFLHIRIIITQRHYRPSSFLQSVQIASGVHPPYSKGTFCGD